MDHSREGVRVMPQGRHSPRWLPEIEAVLILREWQAREHVVKLLQREDQASDLRSIRNSFVLLVVRFVRRVISI